MMLARVAAVVGAAAAILSFATVPAWADPAATGLSPTSGPTGTTVAITGSGLTGAKNATFNGVAAASFTFISDTEVDAVVPPSATNGPVAVVLADDSVVQGPPFTVLPAATLTSSTASVNYPGTAVLTATLSSGGAGVPNQTGTLQSQPAGSSDWTSGEQATTDANGQVHFTVKPAATTFYRVFFPATPAYGETTSNSLRIIQHPLVVLNLPSATPILTSVHVTGYVRPAQTGPVRLERYSDGAWHRVQTVQLTSSGHFVFTIKLPEKATYTYRARRFGDSYQSGNVSSAMQTLGVDRTLRSGLSGPDVTALQRRLLALHYDLGKVTGGYNFDTQHAVTAFEKVNGMTRDGIVTTAVWKRLGTPRAAHLRHHVQGAAIEIDLTRQVLYYAVNGVVRRIFDSSTGGGYYYTGSDGTQQRAITPTGHFAVRYKINKWVKSKLGVLYRPAYFNYEGYAIHGEPEVPSYPASHGCVRITVPAMDRFYSKLAVGVPVWIYRTKAS